MAIKLKKLTAEEKTAIEKLSRLRTAPARESARFVRLLRMQVTKDLQRVRRATLLPVTAYLLLVRLYGKELEPDQGVTIFQLKQRFSE